MKRLTWNGTVKGGMLNLAHRKDFDEALRGFKDGAVLITVETKRSTRSTQQNRLYWKWLTVIGNECGYSSEEMHEVLKFKFLSRPYIFANRVGKIVETVKATESTAHLTVFGFTEYLDKIQRWATEMGIRLPLPEDIDDPEASNT